jgi:GNAT superfamily N-acetyltransferase
MSVKLREARPEDAETCGRICYEAFYRINSEHNFPPDIPSVEMGIGILSMMIGHPGFHVVVAERDGVVHGSNVLDERSQIAGVGPITVDPGRQNEGLGRLLMDHVIERGKRFDGIRLVQAAFHNRSLSLYTKLGFDPREPLSCVTGTPLAQQIPGWDVRPATLDDLAACDAVCQRVHGITRSGEVADAIRSGNAQVVLRDDERITGYTTGIAFFAHSVAETDEDLHALIASAHQFGGSGFLVPTRNAALLRWCLQQGWQIVQPLTLMSMGRYQEPRGSWLASITY